MLKPTGSLLLSILMLGTFWLLLTTKAAHAYIDLGSASFMLQMLLASLFAGLFTIKVFWHRLTGRMSKFFSIIQSRINHRKAERKMP